MTQLVDRIATDTVAVMTAGNLAQRGQLWEALGQLRRQVAGLEELQGLAAFLDAVCGLLEGRQPGEVELEAPFDGAWQRIREGIEGGAHG